MAAGLVKRLSLVLAFVGLLWQAATASDNLAPNQLATSQLATDPLLATAQELLDSGQPTQAYEHLRPLASARAGDFDFDLLLGLAALDAGLPHRAIFALERAVLTQPENPSAHMAIGRAYFALGERAAARNAFQSARALTRQQGGRWQLRRYLRALQETHGGWELSGFAEASAGYDSNANRATTATQIALPSGFGIDVIDIRDGARARDAAYAAIAGGVKIAKKLSKTSSMTADIELQSWRYHQAEDLGTDIYDAALSYRHRTQTYAITASVLGQRYVFDQDVFRNAYGLGLSGQRWMTDRTTLGVFAQALNLRYPDQSSRNARRIMGGIAGYMIIDGTAEQPRLEASASVFTGTEELRDSGPVDLGHRMSGITGRLAYNASPDLNVQVAIAFEDRNYRNPSPLFLASRRDQEWQTGVSIAYRLTDTINITPRIAYVRNTSNIALQSYGRWISSLSIRYQFN